MIPRAVCSGLANQVMNLELFSASLNRGKGGKVMERARVSAKEFFNGNLCKQKAIKAVLAIKAALIYIKFMRQGILLLGFLVSTGVLWGEEFQATVLPKDLQRGDFIAIIKVKGFSGRPMKGCYNRLSGENPTSLLIVGVPDEGPGCELAVCPIIITDPPAKYDGSSDGAGKGFIVDDRYVLKKYRPSDEFRQKAMQILNESK